MSLCHSAIAQILEALRILPEEGAAPGARVDMCKGFELPCTAVEPAGLHDAALGWRRYQGMCQSDMLTSPSIFMARDDHRYFSEHLLRWDAGFNSKQLEAGASRTNLRIDVISSLTPAAAVATSAGVSLLRGRSTSKYMRHPMEGMKLCNEHGNSSVRDLQDISLTLALRRPHAASFRT